MIGKLSDTKLAKLAGVDASHVRYYRKIHGIKPSFGNFSLPPAKRDLLGTAPDTDLARKWGLKAQHLRAYRNSLGIPAYKEPEFWTPDKVALLGRVSDNSLAKEWQVYSSKVTNARNVRGIPPADSFTVDMSIQWTQTMIAKLGTMPDAQLSKILKLAVTTISIKRRELGIATYKKPSKRQAPL
jgi:hypothetical protein